MASDIELRTLKEEAEEALDAAEWLFEELDDIGIGQEMNADTLRRLIPQVKSGTRRKKDCLSMSKYPVQANWVTCPSFLPVGIGDMPYNFDVYQYRPNKCTA